MTARELAARLKVSERTVYRDVQSLSAADIPVYGEAGHEGGYRLVGGYRTRLTGLTAAEAESLFPTGLPVAAADLGLGEAMAEAQLKLMATLPPESREWAARLRERVHLDARSWYQTPTPLRIWQWSPARCGISVVCAFATCVGRPRTRSRGRLSRTAWC